MQSMRWRALAVVAVLGLAVGAWFARPPQPGKLVVMLVFDQFRGDYPQRWRTCYPPGGLRRLMDEGAWFQNCHYNYSDTVTGPGHATLATGCSPSTHGIILNEWFDREEQAAVYCAAELRYEQVPPRLPGAADSKKIDRGSGSPGRLLVPTLADSLRQRRQQGTHRRPVPQGPQCRLAGRAPAGRLLLV